MTIIGKIQDINPKTGMGKTGKPYALWEFMINGERYSSFDGDLATKFTIGDEVEVIGQQNGKYFNMTDLKPYSGNITDTVPTQKINDGAAYIDNRQNSIERQCCLKAAIEFHSKVDDVTIENVTEVADKFLEWVRQ